MNQYFNVEWWNPWYSGWHLVRQFNEEKLAREYYEKSKKHEPHISIRLNKYDVTELDYHETPKH